jgi:uncharacterized protein (TIGR02246 family)
LCLGSVIVLAAVGLVAQEVQTTKPTATDTSATGTAPAAATDLGPEAAPIRQALQGYLDAFNKHDAQAVAALWMPKGVYVDRSTGERVEGQEALEKDFAATFKEKPHAELSGTLKSVRFIRPDVVSAEGEAVETPNPAETTTNRTAFSAIFVLQDGRWLIDSIQESDVPARQPESVALTDLEWLVGHWVDKSKDARVDTVVRWSPRHAFLVRSFTIKTGQDSEPDQGTEIIGWDPHTKQLRSWTFLSDGSFGEATWTKDGNAWTRKGTQTLSDGRSASGTQVITRVDDNTTTVELIAKEIDGEPQPASDPLTVVRVPDEKASPASGTPTEQEKRQ